MTNEEVGKRLTQVGCGLMGAGCLWTIIVFGLLVLLFLVVGLTSGG